MQQLAHIHTSFSRPRRVLIVGDVTGASDALEPAGFRVARTGPAGASLLAEAEPWDLVLVDGVSAGVACADLVRAVRAALPGTPVVAVVDGAPEACLDAMRSGADDCVIAPVTEPALLRAARRNLGDDRWAGAQLQPPPREVELHGVSAAVQLARRQLRAALEADLGAVLVSGPDGAGKTRATQHLHAQRPRAPLVRVGCAGADEATLRRELFGSSGEAGASGGGLWARAQGGYLVLDEVARLPIRLQQAVERLLERQELESWPASRRVRIIGTFTQSSGGGHDTPPLLDMRFMHRFSGTQVDLPALRERREDIRAISEAILRELAERLHRAPFQVSEEAWAHLEQRPWRGNVRELQSELQRAAISAPGPRIDGGMFDTGRPIDDARPLLALPEGGLRLDALERSLVEQALRRSKGNRTHAGQLLGLNRDQVRYRIEKFGIDV